jgi:ubiquinone/menaquinone biosynthesis C-methylase UbiE
MTVALIKEYYTGYVRKEWKRLVSNPYNRLEFDTTCHFLANYLPPNGLLLDAGGGPGRYTVELAKQGYAMTLLDVTPANLEFARRRIKRAGVQKNVREIVEGSIVDLSRFANQTFDAVLCTGGPLSHVLDYADRQKAISELVRVAKPGAPIFVSVMSRLSVLVIDLTLAQFEIELPHFKPMRDTGDYFGGSGFTACHFYLPEELREDFKEQPVEILEMAGLQGISSHHNKKFNQLARDEKRLAIWMETHYQTCTHPSVVGLSEHMLIVCRKRKTNQ